MTIRKYGYRRDPHDKRDYRRARLLGAAPRPTSADLRPRCPEVLDQGFLGSCTAHAIESLVRIELAAVRGALPSQLSPLALYWGERAREGTIDDDAGAYLRDGMKVAATSGIPLESAWSYSEDWRARPDDGAWATGLDHRIATYHRITGLDELRDELADGHPVVFGFEVPESFEDSETARTGVMRPPAPEDQIVAGHAVLAVGYDDERKMLIVRNSWGERWGLDGYFMMPYEAHERLAFDAWAARASVLPDRSQG